MPRYRHAFVILFAACTVLSGCMSSSRKIPPIHQALAAGDLAQARQLAADREQLEALNRYEETPLLYAVRTGNHDLVDYLLGKGANVNYRNFRTGMTPLITAVKQGDGELVTQLIAHGARTDISDNIGQSPLVWSCKGDRTDITETLLNSAPPSTAEVMNQALLTASSHGRTQTIALLLRYGASLSAKTKDSETPLMLAARFGHADTVQWLLTGQARAQIETRDSGGNTPLLWAARMGHGDIVGSLLDASADIDHVNAQGHSALSYAVMLGHADVVRRLAAQGARLNAQRAPALNAMYLSAFQEDIARTLFRHGARLIEVPADTDQALVIALKYLWFGRFYEERLGESGHDAATRQEVINSYDWAAKFFDLAARAYEKAAKELKHEQTMTVWMNIGIVVLGATAAQMQAHLQAQQMAELSALNSPSGTGVGYGWASYQVPEDMAATSFNEKIALMQAEAKRSQASANACREVVACYRRASGMTPRQTKRCLAGAYARISHLK